MKIFSKKSEIITLYEYGTGIYDEPFHVRVNNKMEDILHKYEIIKILEYKFTPNHCIGENRMGMKTYRDDELIIKFLANKK